ncbi:hypothetical protein PRIPAC_85060 [Pristionchus pacificus]|uniref:Uncharacterized protein n=1 Tax=Pristionchus pacificus TaxID=54126 RepID=A0A2A6BV26_PRIPA|nr:hypothetical protein PRIPAC_85060 [Pristionchus pacificus]|eukprot:PDM69676.1 hypothetical protein PRIPAC_44772 [Pristionchus pacificus]
METSVNLSSFAHALDASASIVMALIIGAATALVIGCAKIKGATCCQQKKKKESEAAPTIKPARFHPPVSMNESTEIEPYDRSMIIVDRWGLPQPYIPADWVLRAIMEGLEREDCDHETVEEPVYDWRVVQRQQYEGNQVIETVERGKKHSISTCAFKLSLTGERVCEIRRALRILLLECTKQPRRRPERRESLIPQPRATGRATTHRRKPLDR